METTTRSTAVTTVPATPRLGAGAGTFFAEAALSAIFADISAQGWV